MKTHRPSFLARRVALTAAVAVGLVGFSASVSAQGKKKNPVSKVFVADVNGEATIDTGDSIEDLSKRAVYSAQGTVIETKKPEAAADRSKYFSTMVYSNGTGAFFDADTHVEVKQFVQEPFTPSRTDMDTEPSLSQTQAFVSHGSVGLCVSKLVAGSAMNYQTPHGSVSIRGQKVVIDANKDVTKISMMEGESTVRAGAMDMGGHILHAGEQAIIRSAGAGEPNSIQITKIPDNEVGQLDEKVTMACMAKRTVYFEVREKKGESNEQFGTGAEATEGGTRGAVTAFDGDKDSGGTPTQEIVPVIVVPTNLPTDYTMSASRAEKTPGG
jgi:hypothetical protein